MITKLNHKTCPNCSNIFKVEHGLQKYCCPNCCRRYWDEKHKNYYKNYYKQNKKKILKYYKDREPKYKKKRHNLYLGKKEVILTK